MKERMKRYLLLIGRYFCFIELQLYGITEVVELIVHFYWI